MKIFAVSGSLRAASINSALLRAVRQLAPADIDVELFLGLGDLPLFNPDLERSVPAAVDNFRCRLSAADAILIASPEYARGVTGSIKNALDWLVSYEPFGNKAVAVLNTSPRAHHADAALRETLKTMSAKIVESASVTIPILGTGLDELGMVQTPSVADAIRSMLLSLNEAVTQQRTPQPASPAGGGGGRSCKAAFREPLLNRIEDLELNAIADARQGQIVTKVRLNEL